MSRGVNKVIIIGRLGSDPEIRATASGETVATVSLATDESSKNQQGEIVSATEWHRCVAFGRTAEIIREYVHKGDQIYVEGRLKTRKWQDQNSQYRYTTEIVVRDMQMLGSPNPGGQGGYGQQDGQGNYGQAYGQPANQGGGFGGRNPSGRPAPPPQGQRNQAPPMNQGGGFDDFDDDIPF